MVNIITDSTSDLGAKITAEFGLMVVPLLVTIGGNVYRDGVDIGQKELFSLVEKYGELPKTAAPSVGEFSKAFDRPEIRFMLEFPQNSQQPSKTHNWLQSCFQLERSV